jgi:chitinase
MNFVLLVLLKIFTLSIDIAYGENLKVICYWTSNHKVEDINPDLCTHIHYSFFILDEDNAAPVDELGFPNKEVYDKLNALKQKNAELKIIPAIGGWGDDAAKYSRVAANETKRKIFVNNTIQLVVNNNFDGFDLDWEFPVCWQDDCDAGDEADRDNFSLLIKVRFNHFKLLLLVVVVNFK